MSSAHPLFMWPLPGGFASGLEPPPEVSRKIDEALDRLDAEIKRPGAKHDFLRASLCLAHLAGRLSPQQRARAEAVYLHLWSTPGTGKGAAEEGLLSLIGRAADPASIAFWNEAIALSRVGDAFAHARRILVTAGLALAAKQHPDPAPFEVLRELTAHAHPDVRASAVEALTYLYAGDDGPRDKAVLDTMRHVAAKDPAFEPRFLARRYLGPLFPTGAEGPAVPGAKSVFAFDVTYGRGVRRTIELRADQSLRDLHRAVLRAFGWDNDHLFAFYLNGDVRDRRFEMPSPEETGGGGADFGVPVDDSEDSSSIDMPLGAIGLAAGHKFLYRYDFGDDHRFSIRVAAILPRTAGVKYPRVVKQAGKAPPQYGD